MCNCAGGCFEKADFATLVLQSSFGKLHDMRLVSRNLKCTEGEIALKRLTRANWKRCLFQKIRLQKFEKRKSDKFLNFKLLPR